MTGEDSSVSYSPEKNRDFGCLKISLLISSLLSIAAKECEGPFDVGIIMDISKSVKLRNLPKLRAAVMKVVDEFDVSPDGTHVGIITFAQKANLLFNFAESTYHKPEAIRNRVSKVKNLFADTRTDKALILANNRLFTAAGGDRPDKPNLLLVFTDGRPWPTSQKSGYKPFSETVPPLEVCCCVHFCRPSLGSSNKQV